MMTQGIHSYYPSIYYLNYYTLCTLDTHYKNDPWYTMLLPINILSTFIIHYVPWILTVMMTQGIHSCYPSIYYLNYYTLCTLDTHYKNDPWYTMLLPINILSTFIIPYVPWIHTIMMTLVIHSCYPSIYYLHSLYIMYPGNTL